MSSSASSNPGIANPSQDAEPGFRIIFSAHSQKDSTGHIPKMAFFDTHPVYHWVMTADENDRIVLWDFEMHDVLHEFDVGSLKVTAPTSPDLGFSFRVEDQQRQKRLSMQKPDSRYLN